MPSGNERDEREPIPSPRTFLSVNESSDDAADWALAVRGEGEAFGRVFDRHRARVRRHCIRLVPAVDDAEDALALVFFEAWRKREAIRLVNDSLLPWLLITATNVSHNMARTSRRHRILLSRLPPQELARDHADDFDDGPAHDALRRLSPADQQVIALCVLNDFSEKDAASALGVAAGTVKSRLSRAKVRLARLLAEDSSSSTDFTREVSNDF